MPLYHITGGSGTGKSTVLLELQRRGYEAYDVDEVGPVTARWHNIHTGYIHPKSSVKKEARTPGFLKQHAWRVSHKDVEELADSARTKPVFIGGTIHNKPEINHMFKYTFALVVDNETLKQRLLKRTNNDWGKNPHELQMALDWNKNATTSHKKKGHIIIDATQNLVEVADQILQYIED
jgi:dephospho-CoA kinase